jgi:hypothetical protein
VLDFFLKFIPEISEVIPVFALQICHLNCYYKRECWLPFKLEARAHQGDKETVVVATDNETCLLVN